MSPDSTRTHDWKATFRRWFLRPNVPLLAVGLLLILLVGLFMIQQIFHQTRLSLSERFHAYQTDRLDRMDSIVREIVTTRWELLRRFHSLSVTTPGLAPADRASFILNQTGDPFLLRVVLYDGTFKATSRSSGASGEAPGDLHQPDPLVLSLLRRAAVLQSAVLDVDADGADRAQVILAAPLKERSDPGSAAYIVAFLDLNWLTGPMNRLMVDRRDVLWVFNERTEMIHHPHLPLSVIRKPKSELFTPEELDLVNRLTAEEIGPVDFEVDRGLLPPGFYIATSQRLTPLGLKLHLVIFSSVLPYSDRIQVAMRGGMLTLLVLTLLFMALGAFWMRLKREHISQDERTRMMKDLDRMVEARTVELNFVTRTIKDLIDSIPSGLIVINRQLDILLVNLSFYSIFSSRLVNITGRKISEIFSEEFCDRLRLSLKNKEPLVDLEMRRSFEGHGEKVLLINVLHLLGKRDRLLLVVDDITDRKVLERELIQAEKMAGLGTLMSGIAHEINNPLNAISGMAQIIQGRSQEPMTKELAEQILQYVKKVADIVKELSRYSRSAKVTDVVTTDIHSVIEGAVTMLGHSRKLTEVTVEKRFAHDLPAIRINVTEIEQVLINLMANAVDALEEAAQKRGMTAERKILLGTLLFNNEAVQITVEDNGIGIPPENLSLIFDPFFSTKEQGKGTGLGLSICYKIIQRYNGSILVDSRQGVGTRFTIRLPLE